MFSNLRNGANKAAAAQSQSASNNQSTNSNDQSGSSNQVQESSDSYDATRYNWNAHLDAARSASPSLYQPVEPLPADYSPDSIPDNANSVHQRQSEQQRPSTPVRGPSTTEFNAPPPVAEYSSVTPPPAVAAVNRFNPIESLPEQPAFTEHVQQQQYPSSPIPSELQAKSSLLPYRFGIVEPTNSSQWEQSTPLPPIVSSYSQPPPPAPVADSINLIPAVVNDLPPNYAQPANVPGQPQQQQPVPSLPRVPEAGSSSSYHSQPTEFIAPPSTFNQESYAPSVSPVPTFPVEPATSEKSCPVCTFLNHVDVAYCEACDSRFPDPPGQPAPEFEISVQYSSPSARLSIQGVPASLQPTVAARQVAETSSNVVPISFSSAVPLSIVPPASTDSLVPSATQEETEDEEELDSKGMEPLDFVIKAGKLKNAVSLAHIQEFVIRCGAEKLVYLTARQVYEDFVQQLCDDSSSYASSITGTPVRKATWHVTYAPSMYFLDIVSALNNLAQDEKVDPAACFVWLDIFSVTNLDFGQTFWQQLTLRIVENIPTRVIVVDGFKNPTVFAFSIAFHILGQQLAKNCKSKLLYASTVKEQMKMVAAIKENPRATFESIGKLSCQSAKELVPYEGSTSQILQLASDYGVVNVDKFLVTHYHDWIAQVLQKFITIARVSAAEEEAVFILLQALSSVWRFNGQTEMAYKLWNLRYQDHKARKAPVDQHSVIAHQNLAECLIEKRGGILGKFEDSDEEPFISLTKCVSSYGGVLNGNHTAFMSMIRSLAVWAFQSKQYEVAEDHFATIFSLFEQLSEMGAVRFEDYHHELARALVDAFTGFSNIAGNQLANLFKNHSILLPKSHTHVLSDATFNIFVRFVNKFGDMFESEEATKVLVAYARYLNHRELPQKGHDFLLAVEEKAKEKYNTMHAITWRYMNARAEYLEHLDRDDYASAIYHNLYVYQTKAKINITVLFVESMRRAGLNLLEKDKVDVGANLLMDCVDRYQILYGVKSIQRIAFSIRTGLMFLNRGELDQALEIWEKGWIAFDKSEEPLTEEGADLAHNIGFIHLRKSRFVESEKYLSLALDGRRALFGMEHECTLITTNCLSNVLSNLKRYEEAKAFATWTVIGRLRKFGPQADGVTSAQIMLDDIVTKMATTDDNVEVADKVRRATTKMEDKPEYTPHEHTGDETCGCDSLLCKAVSTINLLQLGRRTNPAPVTNIPSERKAVEDVVVSNPSQLSNQELKKRIDDLGFDKATMRYAHKSDTPTARVTVIEKYERTTLFDVSINKGDIVNVLEYHDNTHCLVKVIERANRQGGGGQGVVPRKCLDFVSEVEPSQAVPDTVNVAISTKGLRLSFVHDLIDACGGRSVFEGLTTTDVCQQLIKPLTNISENSFVNDLAYLRRSDVVLEANWFISHVWSYKFLDVVDTLDYFFSNNNIQPSEAVIWFDLFTNSQRKSEFILVDIRKNDQYRLDITVNNSIEWWTTTFPGVIAKIKNVVMCLQPWDDVIPLTRAWCVYELYNCIATKSSLHFAMSPKETVKFLESANNKDENTSEVFLETGESNTVGGVDGFLSKLRKLRTEHSTATNPSDRDKIFAAIRKQTSFAEIDGLLFREFNSWLLRSFYHNAKRAVEYGNLLESSSWENKIASMMALRELVPEAIEHSHVEYDLKKRAFGQETYETLNALKMTAVYTFKSDPVLGVQLMKECVDKHVALFGKKDARTIQIRAESLFFTLSGSFEEDERTVKEVLSDAIAWRGDNSFIALNARINSGQLYLKHFKFDLGLQVLKDANDAATAKYGPNHHLVLAARTNLIPFLTLARNREEAEKLTLSFYQDAKDYFGRDNASTLTLAAPVMGILAKKTDLYFVKYLGPKAFRETETTLLEYVEDCKRVFGQFDSNALEAMRILGSFYKKQGEGYGKSAAIDVGVQIVRLPHVMYESKRFIALAVGLFLETEKKTKFAFGPNDSNRLKDLETLAVLYHMQDRFLEEIELLKEVLACTREKNGGKDDEHTFTLLGKIGSVYVFANYDADTLRIYKNNAEDEENLKACLVKSVNAGEAMWNSETIKYTYQQLLAARNVFGPLGEKTQMALNLWCSTLLIKHSDDPSVAINFQWENIAYVRDQLGAGSMGEYDATLNAGNWVLLTVQVKELALPFFEDCFRLALNFRDVSFTKKFLAIISIALISIKQGYKGLGVNVGSYLMKLAGQGHPDLTNEDLKQIAQIRESISKL
ncbi:UNVERIFIED_CONTAM: Kinesin light chain 3 [Siphonaria sp. JEL0065]|nr:Kinesin light chain 3 [Siphonaria sp. JEL0065]